jgi:hypothetical protein
LQQVLDSRRRTIKGSPKSLLKRKNTSKVGEVSEQWKKSRKDVRPHKVIHRSAKQTKVIAQEVVTKHISFKP